MKSGLLHTLNYSFRKYHFISREDCIEVWVEKFSASYDTGHRLNHILGFSKDYKRNFQNCVRAIEDSLW